MSEQDVPMNDHESFLLLAAKSLAEPLDPAEESQLEVHLASCPDCRTIMAGMRRDDMRLHAALTPVPVAPRVRERVLAEASGGRRAAAGRIALLLAAALAIGVIGVPLLAGGSRGPAASELPSRFIASITSPALSTAASVEPSPPPPSAAAVPTGPGPLVNANYTYLNRIDSVAARLKDGKPVGEWWRQTEVAGKTESYGGPVTCLVIKGADAWVAGPATTATDGRKDLAILFHLHDGGANGNDSARGYLTNPGQTLTTMQTWCETQYTPAELTPLTTGDVSVEGVP
jgi:hypothetical protein